MPRAPKNQLIALAVAACTLLALPAAAQAQTVNVSVGIGDQNPGMFANPAFERLGIRKVRYFIRWNAITDPLQVANADAYVRNARAAGARVFMHISTSDLRRRRGTLPSLAQYRASVGALVRRYRAQGVREWGVWNEANHDSQETFDNPRRAAQFFLEMRRLCRGCMIVALDLLDQRGVDRYIRRFYAALGRNRRLAGLVGIHNYSDTNRRRSSGTQAIIRAVRRQNRAARFWMTETGGVVRFGGSFRCDPADPAPAERRAARAIDYMFSLTRRFRRDVQRLYIYNWTGEDCQARFDAGLTRRDGTPRPGYERVRVALRRFRR